MKRLLMSGAFSVMLLSPAFAQSYNPGDGTGNVIDLPALEHGGVPTGSASRSFASEPRQTKQSRNGRAQALSPSDADTVYEDGQYLGRDPDPNVRLELRRDWTHD